MEENNFKLDINKIATNLVEDSFKGIVSSTKKGMEKLSKESKDFMEKFSIDFKLSFKKYIENSYEKYSKIKTLLYRTEPKYLYDFFECNELIKEDEIIDPINIDNILSLSHYIIIDGNGGIGKSTMMKHFFINELSKKRFIPIFFELKDYNNFEGSLKECVYKSITTLGCEFEEKYFEYALKNGSFLFLFDGYDEISNSKINKFIYELQELCDKYSENYFIMSSRPIGNFISFQRFTVLKCLPFSREKSINLIKKIDYDKDIKDRFLEELKRKLYRSHQSFASNPLLLTIMLLTYDNYAEIPDKLHIFYEQAFETLYSKHDATKSGYKRELQSNLSKDIFIKIFSSFCFWTYMKEKIEFSNDELNEIFNSIKNDNLSFNNEKFLQDLTNAVCLMYKEGYVYRFTHRSFQEYFTAKYILGLPDYAQKKIYEKLINYKTSDKVLDMLFDMSIERFENNAVIPHLEKIESECKGNREAYYFSKIYGECTFISDGESRVMLSIVIEDIFLLDMYRKYKEKYSENKVKRNIEKTVEEEMILEDIQKTGKDRISISVDDLLKTSKYRTVVQNKTPCFQKADFVSNLLAYIKNSHNTFDIELENLMNV